MVWRDSPRLKTRRVGTGPGAARSNIDRELNRAAVGGAVVDDLDLAVDDVLARAQHAFFDFRRDQLAVVLVQRPVDAAFLDALGNDAGLPRAILHFHVGI